MVGKCAKAFVDVVFGGLNNVPQIKYWMHYFVKEHWSPLQGENHINKTTNGVLAPCYDGWLSIFKGGLNESHKLLWWLKPLCGRFTNEVCGW